MHQHIEQVVFLLKQEAEQDIATQVFVLKLLIMQTKRYERHKTIFHHSILQGKTNPPT